MRLLYDVPHQVTFRWLISIYFYLTGLSAGSFIISTLSYGFGMKRYKPIGKTAVVTATLLLMAAPVALLLQVGWPVRSIWNHFTYINLHSPMSYGGFLLVLYPLNCIVYGLFMFRGDMRMTKILGLVGIPLAISVHGYTGFILAFGKARALWNTALMPILFLVSAIVSGIALMIVIAVVQFRFFSAEKKVPRDLVDGLAKILGWALVVDLVMVFCDIAVLSISHHGAQETAWLILGGNLSPLFVGVENLLGKVVPLIIVFHPRLRTVPGLTIAGLLVVIGIFFMRYVTVFGGQALPLM
ncbi:MAG: NrfD/PsrC family molybdoenzyme membrane anchor subunit [Candidatus Alcyoniella australis]|nr:NrfD/PsrC family molybdoenzyme membrane anchor subunit [Candidatus Alcyoniella australis]